MTGYKAVWSLLSWVCGCFVIMVALKLAINSSITRDGVVFHLCWNLALWFAYQLGELRREISERFPR